MTIREYEFYHGAVIRKIIGDSDEGVVLRVFGKKGAGGYVLNDCVGVYIKHTTSRMPPWRFTFQKQHQDEISRMRHVLDDVFLCLACHDDGVVSLSFSELKQILDETHEPTEWVSVKRLRNTMYEVSGTDGSLNFKVGKNQFPKNLMSAVKNAERSRAEGSSELKLESPLSRIRSYFKN